MENLVTVETECGFFIGEMRGDDGWMILHSMKLKEGVGARMAVQQCMCPEHGEMFTRPFDHRYRMVSEADLEHMRTATMLRLTELNDGIEPFIELNGPMWLEVEFIENVLIFELRPPCGCRPANVSGENEKLCQIN